MRRTFVSWNLQAIHDVDELLQILTLLSERHLGSWRVGCGIYQQDAQWIQY